jgi:two-component system, LytTR family, sensor kinase
MVNSRFIHHSLFWIMIVFIIFLAKNQEDFPLSAIIYNTLLLTIPFVVPIYLHFYILDRFFHKRNYIVYIILLVILYFSSGFIIDEIYILFRKSPTESNAFVGLTLLLFLSTGARYFKKGIFEQYRIQEIEAKQAITELDMLKSQVNPHFLFNTLNNLYALALIKSEKVPNIILKLSGLMRYLLETSKKEWVNLSEEWNYILDYIELEKMRISIPNHIEVNVTGDIKGRKIAPLLLLPLVENAFKHGLNSSSEAFHSSISLEISKKKIVFIVENDIPKTTSKEKNTTKLGIKNLEQRLNLLYQNNFDLNIFKSNTTFKVEMIIDK